MNKKNIEKMIPLALEYLSNDNTIIDQIGKKIKPSCGTHMKAFGPAIRQAGILKAITFYMKEKKGEEEQARMNIAEYVKIVLLKGGFLEEQYASLNLLKSYNEKTASMDSLLEKGLFNKRILESIVACKLALLTYKEEKPVNNNREEANG